jgi:hypothetical protein
MVDNSINLLGFKAGILLPINDENAEATTPPTPAYGYAPVACVYTAYEPYHLLGFLDTFPYPKTAIQTEKTPAHPSCYPPYATATNAGK